MLGGLKNDIATAGKALLQSLSSGAEAERFVRMAQTLGGTTDVLRHAQLPVAHRARAAASVRHAGRRRKAFDVRAWGLAVVALGGGRRLPADWVDPPMGLACVLPLGTAPRPGDALAVVHAASDAEADAAVAAVQAALVLGETAHAAHPIICQSFTAH